MATLWAKGSISPRGEGIAAPGAICLSEQASWQVKGRLEMAVSDLGLTQLKNIAEPVHVYSLEVGQPAQAKPAVAGPRRAKPWRPRPKRADGRRHGQRSPRRSCFSRRAA